MTTTTNKGHNMNEITIIRLPGNFMKAKGVGRMHALVNGTWQGTLNGRPATAASEAEAADMFATACAIAALAGVLG